MRERVDPDNLPEGTLVDCWRVVRRLGGGAYGTVYLVEKDGKLYALKLARFLGNSGDARHTDERAQRELNCLLSLRHPHIVRVRSYGRWPDTETGFFYVVMNYVEGFTLAEWVERTHPTPHEVVALFDKVLSAMAYTHAKGILHRDLKPNNILVEARTGEPVVVDFGAAHFPLPEEPRLTDTRLPPGTPRYTSPEARRFESLHRYNLQAHYEYKAADELYALGVTLYDVLTDPLHHSHPAPQMMGLDGFPAAQEVNARVPMTLSRFAAKLVAREPGHRPVNVEAARRELAEFLSMSAEEWTKRPLHAPVAPPSEAEEAVPLPSAAPLPQAPPAGQVEPQPVTAEPVPPEAPAEQAEVPVPVPVEQAPATHASAGTPPMDTPSPRAHLGPPRRRPRSRTVAVSALMLGLLVGGGAYLGLRGTAHEEPPPSPVTAEPAAPRSRPSRVEAPSPAPSSAPSQLPQQPLPSPLAAPPVPTLEKGPSVNLRPSPQAAVPKLCSQQQPPPRGTPAWLKWCKCAAIAGSLAATQAGCPGVQVRQSLTEECSQESVNSMLLMEVTFEHQFDVELDVKQPTSNGKKACERDASGKVAEACIPAGPLTSRVVLGSGQLVRGTLLSGRAWLHRSWREDRAFYRWTEATLPDGTKHPVCIEGAPGHGELNGEWNPPLYCPNGAARECAAIQTYAVKRWEYPVNP